MAVLVEAVLVEAVLVEAVLVEAVLVEAVLVEAVRVSSRCESELGELGARRHDPHLTRTELDDQGGVPLDADDPAQAVLIVSHLVLLGELLCRRGGRGLEGTCGQVAPGPGAGRFHPFSMRQPSALRLFPRPDRDHWAVQAG
jgi:hypothetical protein